MAMLVVRRWRSRNIGRKILLEFLVSKSGCDLGGRRIATGRLSL
jgi:hypothetical protein